jgi:hypothetical protein
MWELICSTIGMEQQPHESPRSEEGHAEPFSTAPLSAHPEERPSEVEGASRSSAHPEERLSEVEGASRRTPIARTALHLPHIAEPLNPLEPDTALTQTRALRHDGWTPERKRLFLERFAECGIVREACEAAGMSVRSAYNLRDRDPLFAAGWEAACVMARPALADEAYSRARNGVVERFYKDGIVVAERHRYDNRLTMAVLARLDARIDRAEEKGAPHLGLVARWDEYLAALGEDRLEDGRALLAAPVPAPAPGSELHGGAGDRELHELHLAGSPAPAARSEAGTDETEDDDDAHDIWKDEEVWWTNYPPPAGFDGREEGDYSYSGYRRALSPGEQAVIEAQIDEAKAAELARGEAQRDAYFFGEDRSASRGADSG